MEIKNQGDKVYIRRVPTISVGDYVLGGDQTGTGIVYEVPTEDSTELIIDRGKYWAFKIDHIDEFQSRLPLVSEFSANAALQVKIAVDTEVLAYMTTAANVDANNQGATAGAVSGSIDLGADALGTGVLVDSDGAVGTSMVDMIVNMNTVLDENNIPSEGRWCVLPAAMCGLLKKGDLKRSDVTGDSTGLIRSGLIGMVDRMKIYKSNALPMGALEVTASLIPFGTTEATTFAAQITKTDTIPIIESFGTF